MRNTDDVQRPADWGGPYVQAAAFCENVIESRDGVLSLIRMVDRIVRTVVSTMPVVHSELPPIRVSLNLVIALKSGYARGTSTIWIEGEAPLGLQLGARIESSILFEGEDRGVNLIIPVEFEPKEEGIYWFTVGIATQVLTRVPLRVVGQTQIGGRPVVQ